LQTSMRYHSRAVLLGAVALLATRTPGLLAQVAEGRQVIVNGRAWWLSCTGTGTPAVVLEAGHTESSDTWRAVQLGVAEFTRVCSYDRAGRGRSGPIPGGSERTASDAAGDLATLLRAGGERGPYVLVGHSLGGPLVRVFATTVPAQVAGMVLVDAVHEREFEAIDSLLTPAQRVAGAGMRPMSPERFDIEAILRDVRQRSRSIPWPLVVVARGRPLAEDEMPPSWSPAQRQQREQLRRSLQQELAALSRHGRLVVADSSGHHVHHDQPDVVVTAIRDLVEGHRRAGGR